jgi:hypothetical protein
MRSAVVEGTARRTQPKYKPTKPGIIPVWAIKALHVLRNDNGIIFLREIARRIGISASALS